GDVIEIALHTVKVQNWDKTVTTIPIRKLVTDSFKNWRGMQESGGRRIKRAIFLDQTSIRFLKQDDYEKLASFGHLETYLEKKRAELAEWNAKLGERANVPANTRRTTNIGTLRAYLENYLRSHPGIHQAMTIMVRQLPPGPEGLPLEIYCFTNTTAWAAYEGVQADIFDHVLSILPEFDLRVFQNPSGQDFRELCRPSSRDAKPLMPEPALQRSWRQEILRKVSPRRESGRWLTSFEFALAQPMLDCSTLPSNGPLKTQ